MLNTSYAASINDILTCHAPGVPMLLHDMEERIDAMRVQALVASRDCFIMLASELDSISDLLEFTDKKHTQLELEKLARLLMYLQQHYEIKRKT